MIDYAIMNGMDSEEIFVKNNALPHILMDHNEWITKESWCQVADCVSEFVNKSISSIAYEIAKYNYNQNFKLSLIKIFPISLLKSVFPRHLNKKINKNFEVTEFVYNPSDNNLIFSVTPIDKDQFDERMCLYNKGTIIGVMDFKGYYGLRIRELACAVESKTCVYEITWRGRSSFVSNIVSVIKGMFRSNDINVKDTSYGVPLTEDDLKNLFEED